MKASSCGDHLDTHAASSSQPAAVKLAHSPCLTLLARYRENCHLFRVRIPTIVIGLATLLLRLASLNSLALSSRLVECVVRDIFPTEPDDLAYPACAPGGVRARGGHEAIPKQKESQCRILLLLWKPIRYGVENIAMEPSLLCAPQFLPCPTPTPFLRFEKAHSLPHDDERSPIPWSERHSTR